MPKQAPQPHVEIIMGSDSDYATMKDAGAALKSLRIKHNFQIISAHRTPDKMWDFAKDARKNGVSVIIAGAGGAAHLPGMVAALTDLPVIGVPVPIAPMDGTDSLYSIVQMPKGVPVATVAIGNSYNAGLLAAQILSVGNSSHSQDIAERLGKFKAALKKKVLNKKLPKN